MKTLSLSVIAAMAFTGTALAQSGGEVQLTAQQAQGYGTYVADAEGRTLYLFTTDTQGQGDSQASSSCQDKCAEVWPPLTTEGQPQAGNQLKQELLGSFQREDGQTQVTYGGWPLYYFVKDQQAGDVNGQDVHGFGGEWYLVTPEGSKNEQQKQEQ
ncbi:COG4315 family predicted lipoprotein [Halomonas sp. WWR20]